MSYGLAICSVCFHEVHQMGPRDAKTQRYTWKHCEDKTPLCDGAVARYPDVKNGINVRGNPCYADDMKDSNRSIYERVMSQLD